MSISFALGLAAALAFLALYALFAVLAERKISARIQDRIGPNEVGPRGSYQTLADILKLLQKENVVPAAADRFLFEFAPLLVFAAVFAGFAVVPFAPGFAGAALNLGVLYLIAVVSMDAIGLLLAGWASNNKYSLLGGMRAAAQILAYEVPAGLALLAALVLYGTLDLAEINALQGVTSPEPQRLWGLWEVREIGGVLSWGVVRYPHLLLALGLFFVAGLAESNRAPFDLPEAESELIGGFHTEYAGFRFGVLFLAEYGMMLLVSLVAATVFLGGWNSPLPNVGGIKLAEITTGTTGDWTGALWGGFWLLSKAFAFVYVMIWVRWSFPRLRPDQLVRLCWKYLTPAGLASVIGSILWRWAEA